MSYASSETIAVTTDTGGAATAYSGVVNGRIVMVRYTKNNFSNGVDFTITTEDTAQNLWVESDVNASDVAYPVVAATLAGTGAASTLTEVPVYACNERVKIVIASGGNATSGTFRIVVA